MTTYTYLSDEWFEQVDQLKAAVGANAAATPGFAVNCTVTGVPFGSGTIELHSDSGPMFGWQRGHDSEATLAFTVDYQMARAMVLDQSEGFDVLVNEIDSGALHIEGDTAQLHTWFRTRVSNPEALAVEDQVRRITA
jgi:hypothetical protein